MAEQAVGAVRDAAEPIDVINTIALTACQDTRHRLYFEDSGGIRSLTLAELDSRAMRVAGHLHELGVRPRDRIGVIAGNRIEFVLLDIAIFKLGAVIACIEPHRYVLEEAIREFGLRLLFAEDETARGSILPVGVIQGWADDASADPAMLPAIDGYDPADICAIKKTSGSTGFPKGIETSTVSVNYSLAAVQDMFGHGDGDNLLILLSLRFLQQRYWIYSALVHGHDVTLASRVSALDVARACSPTVIMGVPGFYEQLKDRIEAAGAPADLAARGEAIQAQLGGRVRYMWTGSAPAGRAMLDFFNDAGVPLYEGYGLNETCIVSKNHPGAFRVGSVGKVLPHKRIRFDKDGILIVGTSYPVNTRYTWCPPGESEKVYLPTGEVKTYDIGHVDEDGFLYIDGRVDDIVTLSSALNILVPLVEEHVRELPGVHDCAVFGDGQPFLAAIVSPAAPNIDHKLLVQEMARLNSKLNYEQRIYGIVIADEQFSVDNGLLNAQFKLMRTQIGSRYAAQLDQVYQEQDVYNDGTLGDARILVLEATRAQARQLETA